MDEIDPQRERKVEVTFASSRRYDIEERNEWSVVGWYFEEKVVEIDTEEDKKYKRDVSGYEQRECEVIMFRYFYFWIFIYVVRSWKQILYVYVAFICNVRKSSIICVYLRNSRE